MHDLTKMWRICSIDPINRKKSRFWSLSFYKTAYELLIFPHYAPLGLCLTTSTGGSVHCATSPFHPVSRSLTSPCRGSESLTKLTLAGHVPRQQVYLESHSLSIFNSNRWGRIGERVLQYMEACSHRETLCMAGLLVILGEPTPQRDCLVLWARAQHSKQRRLCCCINTFYFSGKDRSF